MDRSKLNKVERALVDGLDEFVENLESEKPLATKYTLRTVATSFSPSSYTAADVRATRNTFRVSQGLFAKMLGVSVKTVAAWELGKKPSGIACRFLDEMRLQPEYWKRRIQAARRRSAKQKR